MTCTISKFLLIINFINFSKICSSYMHRGPFGDRRIDTLNPHFQRHVDIAFDPVYEQMFDDMIMTHEIADSLFSPFAKRNGILDRSYLWRNATVYYFIDDEYNNDHRNVIKYGIDMIRKTTCINFVQLSYPSQARGPYVHINSGAGCYSSIGSKCLNGVCKMSLQIPGCVNPGTVAHEFLHVLGFFHMQCSSGRNEYIFVNFSNIPEDMHRNFDEYATESTLLDTKYDYESIMHYGRNFFAMDKRIPTIVTRDQRVQNRIGQRTHLSRGDILRAQMLYNCNK